MKIAFICDTHLPNNEKSAQYIYFSDTKKVLGKDEKRVQICIQKEGISRLHATLVRENGEYIIEDLNSTNGTWINGEQLTPRTPYVLHEGDKISFAETEYIFR